MKTYIIYTNKLRPFNINRPACGETRVTYHTDSKENAMSIIADVKASGYRVTAVTTGLGSDVNYKSWAE